MGQLLSRHAQLERAAAGRQLRFDELGYPIQEDGSSTVVPGLHFMGVHFQRKRKSASLRGVTEDAAILAERIRVEPAR